MSIPVQLTFDFHGPQAVSISPSQVPIDRTFPEEAANKLATIESFNKHLYRPNTYLHKWWARRSGTTFRHILKQLVNDPGKSDFYEPGGLSGKIILDPMMGGGTTLHEAIRMGANVVGVDVDPIPVLQVKASLNWTPVRQKMKTFQSFFTAVRSALHLLYQTCCPVCNEPSEIQFVLYALRRKCHCREVLFVDSLTLRENSDGSSVRLCSVCGQVYTTSEIHCGNRPAHETILTKDKSSCELCCSSFRDLTEEPFSERYSPIVILIRCSGHGQLFKTVDQRDREVLKRAKETAQTIQFGEHEEFQIPSGPKSNDLLRRNINSFLELFTSRQLLYLHTTAGLLSSFPPHDRLWLSLLVSTSLEFNCLLCGYKGVDRRRPGAIRHVFSHHAYSFPYTALENNPVFGEKTSGTLQRLFADRIVRGGRWAMAPIERRIIHDKRVNVKIHGEVDGGRPVSSFEALLDGERRFYILQADSRRLAVPDNSVDYVVTDPPYYDSVQYSDLSNFFRVWLRLLLPNEADWTYERDASAVFEGRDHATGGYAEALTQIWNECARVLKGQSGRLIFTFHHWRPEAWAELTISLKRTRFVLINRYVVFSENPISVHIRNLKALKHDAILVLKPDGENSMSTKWSRPSSIDSAGSSTFCNICAGALGWFLGSDLAEDQIRSDWGRLLNGM